MQTDTICAPATAPGGALGIIRLSGPKAFEVVSSICSVRCDTVAANTLHYTQLVNADGETLDEAVVSIFRAPHSYTGQNCVEISCHGSRYIMNKVLELLIDNGCRMARPGEFSMRAFLNGKMDLSQAEAVADLIAANNRATHQMALSQLRGHFSSELDNLRTQLLELTSLLELELDFSDHEDLQFANRTQLLSIARTIDKHITRLTHTFETGQALKHGIPVAIIGKTNVGKSTLLNRLLHDDRAIVSDVHGTTRDTIEDTIDIRGVTFRFIDTAGIRQTTDEVELIGISRTYQAIANARIVLWLIDTIPTDNELADIAKRTEGKSLLIVQNKIDLIDTSIDSSLFTPIPTSDSSLPHHPTSNLSFLKISAKTGQGLSELESAIYSSANIPDLSANDIIVSNARHYNALLSAHTNLLRVIDGLNIQLPTDIVAEDLRQVLTDLADITGNGQVITSQETLNHIFAHHCVGK